VARGAQEVGRRWAEGRQKVGRRRAEGGKRWAGGNQKVGRRWALGGRRRQPPTHPRTHLDPVGRSLHERPHQLTDGQVFERTRCHARHALALHPKEHLIPILEHHSVDCDHRLGSSVGGVNELTHGLTWGKVSPIMVARR
jgi:hypothetical protein